MASKRHCRDGSDSDEAHDNKKTKIVDDGYGDGDGDGEGEGYGGDNGELILVIFIHLFIFIEY